MKKNQVMAGHAQHTAPAGDRSSEGEQRAAFFLPLSAVVVFLFCVLVHVLYDIVSDFSNDYSILRFYNVKENIAEVESSSVFCSARGQ